MNCLNSYRVQGETLLAEGMIAVRQPPALCAGAPAEGGYSVGGISPYGDFSLWQAGAKPLHPINSPYLTKVAAYIGAPSKRG